MGNRRQKPTVTIVDDEPYFSESLQMALEDHFAISVVGSIKLDFQFDWLKALTLKGEYCKPTNYST